MKRPWHYKDGVWATSGTIDWKELNDWAAFYGKDFQTALTLATRGKIPMWFAVAYTRDRLVRACRMSRQVLRKEATRILEAIAGEKGREP